MHLSLTPDGSRRLTCVISDGRTEAAIPVPADSAALSALAEAVETTATDGTAECFWRHADGEYRWIFRKAGDNARLVVLWSTGTLTGWEHVFWSECDFEVLRREVAQALACGSSTAGRSSAASDSA